MMNPVVDAGPVQSAMAGASVSFAATATAASGSNIASYLWEQVDATNIAVTLNNEDQLSATFVAPYVSSATALIFRLTVEDSEGRTSSDMVTITINADPNAPSVYITFPPPASIYNPTDNGNKISIFGNATAKGGATISSITIKGGSVDASAVIAGQLWRADHLDLPGAASEIELVVEAEDSLGRITQERVHLTVSEDYGPDSTGEARAILWDESLDTLWLLRKGNITSDTRIIPVNPRTGVRGASILATSLAAHSMIFNADQSAFIVSGQTFNNPGEVNLVNKSNGAVSLISGAVKGVGPDLGMGSAGLALDENGGLYIAENVSNGFSGIMKVNLSSGDREIVLESVDSNSLAYAIADIAYANNEVFLIKNSFSNSRIYGFNVNTEDDRQVNSGNSSLGSGADTIVSDGDIFGVSAGKNLMRINIATGAVSQVSNKLRSTGGASYKLFTYDKNNRLFYSAARRQSISVIDEVSGYVVDLAGQ